MSADRQALAAAFRCEAEAKADYDQAKAVVFLALRKRDSKDNISVTRERVTIDPKVVELRAAYEDARVTRTLLERFAEADR